jgi:molecular chaperone DnaK
VSTTVWGIDLGTTYSCIARVDEFGRPVVVSNRDGDPTTPSVVLFTGPEEYQVGKEAKRQAQLDPDNVCELVKRHMGDPDWRFRAHGHEWAAPAISALILKSLAADAELQTGEPVTDVVITVPAYFGDAQREATRAAGKIAGLSVAGIINEPTAAAFSYGFAQQGNVEETVLVYDLGGGTFDVTVVRIADGDITVIVTDGDHLLGGANWDERLVQEIAKKFMEAEPAASDPLDDEFGAAELKARAEDIKRALTARDSVSEMVIAGTSRASVSITREEFESVTQDLLEQTITLTRSVLAEATAEGFGTMDRVLLVGGSSFMPAVARRLSEEFAWTPELEDPNQAVAKGAALAGQRSELRTQLGEELERTGKDMSTASTAEIEQALETIAPEAGLDPRTAMTLATTNITNVCSRGFGVMLLKDGHDPASEDPDDHFIKHMVQRNDRVPLDPPRTDRVATTVPNQRELRLELWEQGGADISEDLADNNFLEAGSIALPGDDPVHTPLDLVFEMDGEGKIIVTLTHPRVSEPLRVVRETGGVMSESEMAEAQSKVAALSRA